MATAQESPKEELPHRHHADIVAHPGSDDLNTAAVQDGYFKSAPFVGTMFAAGFGMIGVSVFQSSTFHHPSIYLSNKCTTRQVEVLRYRLQF